MSAQKPPVCDYEGSNYQREFWDAGTREYEDRVEAVALQRLLPRDGDRLLEIGAGAGRNTLRYSGFREITLLDYSRSQLELARERLGESDRFRYVIGDVYRLPFAAGAFAAATMIRTLHHMAEPARAISAVRSSLRTGSPLILEYPNKRNLKAIARWLAGRQAWSPFSRVPVEFARLNYDFHPGAVRSWLTEGGFVIRRQLTVSHFRTGFLKRVVPLGLLVRLDSAAQWTGDLWQLSPSVFTLALAVGSDAAGGRGFWRCPECGSITLIEVEQGKRCSGCGRIWGLREGIWDFREPVV